MITIDNILNYKNSVTSDENIGRCHVPLNSIWIAYKAYNVEYKLYDITIKAQEDIKTKAIGYYADGVHTILAAKGVDYNSLYYAGLNSIDSISVPESETIGYLDKLYRIKYVIVPEYGYWRPDGLPILITKTKR